MKLDIKPIVQHIIAPSDGLLSQIVADTLEMPNYYIKDLLKFGAIYTCPVMPKSSLSIFNYDNLRETLMKRHGRHPKHQNPMRMTIDKNITMGSYIRVHLYPKRFPMFYGDDVKWEDRILFDCHNFVVVNKPSGCQVPPRVDNCLECLITWIQKLNIISVNCIEEFSIKNLNNENLNRNVKN